MCLHQLFFFSAFNKVMLCDMDAKPLICKTPTNYSTNVQIFPIVLTFFKTHCIF